MVVMDIMEVAVEDILVAKEHMAVAVVLVIQEIDMGQDPEAKLDISIGQEVLHHPLADILAKDLAMDLMAQE